MSLKTRRHEKQRKSSEANQSRSGLSTLGRMAGDNKWLLGFAGAGIGVCSFLYGTHRGRQFSSQIREGAVSGYNTLREAALEQMNSIHEESVQPQKSKSGNRNLRRVV